MKKFFFVFLLLVVSTALPIFLSFAKSTPTPTVDDPISPIDAALTVITGTTDPGASIFATGGPYEIAPVTADKTGKFSISVALAQETTNIFFIQAQDSGSDLSDSVEVDIVEGKQATAAYESAHGVDRTAPEAPGISPTTLTTDQKTLTLTGSGEANTSVLVNSVDSGEKVNSDGNFSVNLTLSGNGVKDSFTLQLQDAAGNLSSGILVHVTSSATVTGVDTSALPPLTDISGHWAESVIDTLYNKGVVSGYGDGRFGPDDPLTRAQIMKIALRAFNVDTTATVPSTFNDVAGAAWYSTYVNTGASIGIVSGYSDGSFKPDHPVTRAEALKIVLETAGFTDLTDTSSNFSDVDSVRDWFAKYTAFAKKNGILSGYSDGTFRGNQEITRAEVCEIVQKVVDYVAGQG